MKPKPISYYGGKQRIASKIIPHLPPHTVYVEPFCGGCAVLFNKGKPCVSGDYYREVINDKNGDLINMFRVLQRNQELKHWLEFTLYSRKEFDRAKKLIKEENASDIEKAWSFFVLIHWGFSKKLHSGFSTSIISHNSSNVHRSKILQIHNTIDRLRFVCIENDSAINTINRWDSPQTCFYCDPPYPGADQGHYKGYTTDDYNELLETLETCKGSFVLSNYKQGTEPKHWKRIDINATMSVAKSKRKKRIESIWIVDRSENVKEDLKKHLWSPGQGFPYQQHGLFK